MILFEFFSQHHKHTLKTEVNHTRLKILFSIYEKKTLALQQM
jgi:hypothetical protein